MKKTEMAVSAQGAETAATESIFTPNELLAIEALTKLGLTEQIETITKAATLRHEAEIAKIRSEFVKSSTETFDMYVSTMVSGLNDITQDAWKHGYEKISVNIQILKSGYSSKILFSTSATSDANFTKSKNVANDSGYAIIADGKEIVRGFSSMGAWKQLAENFGFSLKSNEKKGYDVTDASGQAVELPFIKRTSFNYNSLEKSVYNGVTYEKIAIVTNVTTDATDANDTTE